MLEVNLDSIADQSVDFGFGERVPVCKLSRAHLPQLSLDFPQRINHAFQAPYYRRVQEPIRELIKDMSES